VIARAEPFGYFVNSNTLEPELFTGGLAETMQHIIEEELPRLGAIKRAELQRWVNNPASINVNSLIALIERIGKGRFAQALASHVTEDTCPDYIRDALEHIRDAVA
jgi:putative ATP-dependent endonuclease of OLD family